MFFPPGGLKSKPSQGGRFIFAWLKDTFYSFQSAASRGKEPPAPALPEQLSFSLPTGAVI
jgi:hypothetical protein